VANQLLALLCLSYNRVRRGDPVGAVLDSIFWFIALPAAIILSATLFVEIPDTTRTAALGALAVGVVGLVATQGRNQDNIFARIGLGIASLYGVAGTYGFSSFLNDVLSYSRLLALGMATTIVGLAFNILANMARVSGFFPIDLLLVLLILVPGHGANFFLGILGGFVHSVRLVFVEFFGRFYEAEAPAFEPLGRWTGRLNVTDAPTVWPGQP
jgi:V/A-type H+-transporting ATPase subunit I